jgi:hypothetical protein
VKPVLLYACETWEVTQQITNRIQVYINGVYGALLPENISNELWKFPKQKPIAIQIKRKRC